MPELPEVETLKRELNRALRGKRFADAEVFWAKTIKPLTAKKFNALIKGKKIIDVDRRAKILIFKLVERGRTSLNLLIHLKMTGQLIYENKGHFPDSKGSTLGTLKVESWEKSPRWRFTRVIFTFTDGSRLLFNDLRKFGWIKIVSETDLPKIFRETGVEPLSRNFTLTRFTEIIARYPKRKIKSLLLDQKLIAGLGNIYTDESCFLAGILPTRIIKSLTLDNRKKLHSAIIKVLKLAISKKGTSARDYVRANGQPGSFVPYLNVYGRDQKNCKICGAKISKIKLNGRGTHFCAHCQK